jgi:hypothetical protein
MFLARLTFGALMPEPALIVVTLCVAVVGAWFIHETIEVPGRRLLVLIWQDNRWRLVSRETPADQMDRAILDLQEIEKRLLSGATSAMADQRQISATAEPSDGADGAVIQDNRDEKLRA